MGDELYKRRGMSYTKGWGDLYTKEGLVIQKDGRKLRESYATVSTNKP